MELSIIETIGKHEKTGETLYQVKTECFCCGEEMEVVMTDEIYYDCEKYPTEIWCQDCAISEGKVSKRMLKKMEGRVFYLSIFYREGESYKGEKPANYSSYLRTEHWKKIRQDAIDRAGGRCQLCNKPSNLHVHHRTYENVGNEQPGDLIVLCAHCHAKFHDKL